MFGDRDDGNGDTVAEPRLRSRIGRAAELRLKRLEKELVQARVTHQDALDTLEAEELRQADMAGRGEVGVGLDLEPLRDMINAAAHDARMAERAVESARQALEGTQAKMPSPSELLELEQKLAGLLEPIAEAAEVVINCHAELDPLRLQALQKLSTTGSNHPLVDLPMAALDRASHALADWLRSPVIETERWRS